MMRFELNETTFIAITAPFYLIIILTEIFASHFQLKKYYSFKETLINIYLTVANASVDLLFRSIYLFIILQWFYDHRVMEFHQHPWLYWLLLFIGEDFVYYFEQDYIF